MKLAFLPFFFPEIENIFQSKFPENLFNTSTKRKRKKLK